MVVFGVFFISHKLCGGMSQRKALQSSIGPTLISSAMFVERCLVTTPIQPSTGRLDGCPEQQSAQSKAREIQQLHHRDMGGRWRQIAATTLEPVSQRGSSDQQQSWRVPQQVEEPDPKSPSQPVWVRHTHKESQGTDRARRAQVNHGGAPPKRRQIYRELDERLVRLKDRLTTGRKTPMQ